MSSDDLRMMFFVQLPDGTIEQSELRIEIPVKRWERNPSSYEALATFPHILPDGHFSSRNPINYVAVRDLMSSVRQFSIDFEKEGGKLFLPDPEDESKPFLFEAVKAKSYFKV